MKYFLMVSIGIVVPIITLVLTILVIKFLATYPLVFPLILLLVVGFIYFKTVEELTRILIERRNNHDRN